MPLSCASPWEHHCLSVLHIVFQANFANGSAAMVNRYWQGYLGGICLEQLHCCLDLADTVSTCANRMLSFSDPPMEDLQALEWEIGRALAMANYHRRISCSYWKDMDPKSFTFILANLYERPIPSNFFLIWGYQFLNVIGYLAQLNDQCYWDVPMYMHYNTRIRWIRQRNDIITCIFVGLISHQ